MTTLRSLTAQAVAASDPEYLREQSTEQLGVLHGVLADRALRMLELHSGRG